MRSEFLRFDGARQFPAGRRVEPGNGRGAIVFEPGRDEQIGVDSGQRAADARDGHGSSRLAHPRIIADAPCRRRDVYVQ